jgi:hypothetical protein
VKTSVSGLLIGRKAPSSRKRAMVPRINAYAEGTRYGEGFLDDQDNV